MLSFRLAFSLSSFTFIKRLKVPAHFCHYCGSVQSLSHCPTLCNPMDCSTPGLPVHHQLPEFTQIHVHWVGEPSNHLILCRSLFLPPSLFPSIRVFSNESVLCIKWPKYWRFSFSISISNEYSGLISFRMDWLDLLAVQGTLKSLLQHHSSKASILRCSAFFIVPFSGDKFSQLYLQKVKNHWENEAWSYAPIHLSMCFKMGSALSVPSIIFVSPAFLSLCVILLSWPSFSLPFFLGKNSFWIYGCKISLGLWLLEINAGIRFRVSESSAWVWSSRWLKETFRLVTNWIR